MLPFLAKVDVGAMAMKGCCIPQSFSFTGTSPSEFLVSYKGHSLWGVLSLYRVAVGVFCIPSHLGNLSSGRDFRREGFLVGDIFLVKKYLAEEFGYFRELFLFSFLDLKPGFSLLVLIESPGCRAWRFRMTSESSYVQESSCCSLLLILRKPYLIV